MNIFVIVVGIATIICAIPILVKFAHWLKLRKDQPVDNTAKPVVFLELLESQAAGYKFKVKNIGSETAINLKISENTVLCRNNAYPLEENKEKMENPKFNMPSSLCSGEEKLLTPLQKGEQDLWIIKKPGIVKIEYSDLRNTAYARKFAITEKCKDKKGWTYYKIELAD